LSTKGTPQTNFLAATGLAADPKGDLVNPPRGPWNLAWLCHVSAETGRRGRERLAQGNVRLGQETLLGWFCVANPGDLMALDQLEQRAWRKALKIWKGQDDQRWAMHNRATLHRLMYLAEESENRGVHLRKAAELYHRLLQDAQGYTFLAEWAFGELKRAVVEANKVGDDEMVAKSLLLISQTQGMAACEELQEKLMLTEVDDLALLVATLIRDLLPYQGVVHAPPRALLQNAQESAELEVLPPAVRLAFRLVAGSRQRRRIDSMVAELCGLLAQSLFKGGEGRSGKKWQSEARRWEPQVADEWKEPPPRSLGDEQAARVEFSELESEEGDSGPRNLGPAWFGIRGEPTLVLQHEAREEWLEAIRLFGLAIFPLRRFAVYRNLDTGELGRSQRLSLTLGHYIWQTIMVVLLSFALLGVLLRASPQLLQTFHGASAPTMDPAQRKLELTKTVERLSRLAQVEADLRKQPKPDAKRLEAIESERQALFEKVQRLEQGGNP
jgi:hypothetical protein